MAAGHLRAYLDQPSEFSCYLAAERLVAEAELSGEQRAAIVAELVRATVGSGDLVAWGPACVIRTIRGVRPRHEGR